MRLLLTLALLTSLPVQAQGPENSTETPAVEPAELASAEVFGALLLEQMQNPRAGLADQIDAPSVAMRVAAGWGSVAPEDRAELQRSLDASHRQLLIGIGQTLSLFGSRGDQLRLLRVAGTSDGPQLVVRVLINGGVNYLRIQLAQVGGVWRITDLHDLASGEWTTTRIAETMAVSLGIDPITGVRNTSPLADHGSVQKLTRARDLFHKGEPQECYDMVRGLAAEAAKLRFTSALRVICAQPLSATLYASELERHLKAFPNDPSINLHRVDHHMMRGESDEAIEAIDVVSASLGGDPHLDAMRGMALMTSGERTAGLALARGALAEDPALPLAHTLLISSAWSARNSAEVLRLLDHARSRDITLQMLNLTIIPGFYDDRRVRGWLTRHNLQTPTG